ncbi:MAG: hypothetical protein JRN54_03440 [Nitrososphaerota archaeon]|nr:hypothetical protein [Nitrososphaerota archaeon]
MSRMGPMAAFFLGFAVWFIVAFLAVDVLSLPFFFIASFFGAGLSFLLIVAGFSALIGFLGGVVSLVMYYIWSALDRTQQFVLVVALLAIGLLFVQVELDAVALIGLALTMSGVGKGPGRSRKGGQPALVRK